MPFSYGATPLCLNIRWCPSHLHCLHHSPASHFRPFFFFLRILINGFWTVTDVLTMWLSDPLLKYKPKNMQQELQITNFFETEHHNNYYSNINFIKTTTNICFQMFSFIVHGKQTVCSEISTKSARCRNCHTSRVRG